MPCRCVSPAEEVVVCWMGHSVDIQTVWSVTSIVSGSSVSREVGQSRGVVSRCADSPVCIPEASEGDALRLGEANLSTVCPGVRQAGVDDVVAGRLTRGYASRIIVAEGGTAVMVTEGWVGPPMVAESELAHRLCLRGDVKSLSKRIRPNPSVCVVVQMRTRCIGGSPGIMIGGRGIISAISMG